MRRLLLCKQNKSKTKEQKGEFHAKGECHARAVVNSEGELRFKQQQESIDEYFN